MIEHVRVDREGQECDVFFFKSWGSYSHPVKPEDPIAFEEALRRDGFSRAWLCGPPENQRFILFEGIRISRSELPQTSVDSTHPFYEWVIGKDGTGALGSPMEASKTIGKTSFVFIDRVNGEAQPQLIEQVFTLKFEYEYSESGDLKKVITTNASGEVKELAY